MPAWSLWLLSNIFLTPDLCFDFDIKNVILIAGEFMDKYKILMIDDEVNYPTAFKFLTEMKGDYEVLIASSGVEGLEAAKKNKPDVITLDVMLAGEDGVEVLRQIRNDESIKDIPVIMMSGVEVQETRKSAQELGIEEFLSKPVEMEDLLHRINIIKAKNSISRQG